MTLGITSRFIKRSIAHGQTCRQLWGCRRSEEVFLPSVRFVLPRLCDKSSLSTSTTGGGWTSTSVRMGKFYQDQKSGLPFSENLLSNFIRLPAVPAMYSGSRVVPAWRMTKSLMSRLLPPSAVKPSASNFA